MADLYFNDLNFTSKEIGYTAYIKDDVVRYGGNSFCRYKTIRKFANF